MKVGTNLYICLQAKIDISNLPKNPQGAPIGESRSFFRVLAILTNQVLMGITIKDIDLSNASKYKSKPNFNRFDRMITEMGLWQVQCTLDNSDSANSKFLLIQTPGYGPSSPNQ